MGCGKSAYDNIDCNPLHIPSVEFQNGISINEINDVHKLPMDLSQNKLIEHFDILFQHNKIKWPQSSSRNK